MGRQPATTGLDMVTSGQWVKVGRKHYRHASGEEVRHDGAAWVACGLRWSLLWVARHEVEKRTAAAKGGAA